MIGSPGAGADDRAADLEASETDAGWLLIASLMSLVGFLVLSVAVANRIVVPPDRPSLTPDGGWDGWPAMWRAISETANASLIFIGVGIGLGLLWLKRRPQQALAPGMLPAVPRLQAAVPRLLAAATAARGVVRQPLARVASGLRSAGSDPRVRGIVGSYRPSRALEDWTILWSVALRTWRRSRPLPSLVRVVYVVAADVFLVVVARVALDTSYPGDILAGILGGTAALTLYTWFTSPVGLGLPAAEMHTADLHEAPGADSVRTIS